jgi:hypothetical protein
MVKLQINYTLSTYNLVRKNWQNSWPLAGIGLVLSLLAVKETINEFCKLALKKF